MIIVKKILLVDDEAQILRSLYRIFIDTDYEVFTAETGMDALTILEEETIDLIISDMRMPFMDGYQLLSVVKEKYPKILRVILSGYADEKIVLKALQQNIAKIYLFKPWNNTDLLNLINQMFETEEMLTSNELKLLINNLEDLPALESTHQRIIQLIEDDADIEQISKVIEQDQSVSTQVLHIANSAYYGVKTGSLNQAISFLGLQNIRNITLSTSIMNVKGISGAEDGSLEKFWKHSFLTNKLFMYIYSRHLHAKLPEVATSAGLLHNIGEVFMLNYLSKDYIKQRRKAQEEGISILEFEQQMFKVTHQQVGGYLLRWWELPFPIVEAALFHHNPLDSRIVNKELISAVHIAQKYAWDILRYPQLTEFYPEIFEEMGLDQHEFEDDLRDMAWG